MVGGVAEDDMDGGGGTEVEGDGGDGAGFGEIKGGTSEGLAGKLRWWATSEMSSFGGAVGKCAGDGPDDAADGPDHLPTV